MALCAPAQAQPLISSNLPIIVIEAGRPIPDSPRVMARMAVIHHGPGQRNRPTDPPTGYDGPIAIEIRGSSSQSFPKKSYAVELRTTDGQDAQASLLDLPAEEDWIIHGPYSDKSFLRNALVMHLSNRIGRYASRTRFVELVLDGSYEGVYVLMEKVKRDRNRVDIAQLTPDEITGTDLTGGYILKIDKSTGDEFGGWTSTFPPRPGSAERVFIQYHYPRPSEITPEQKAYIQGAVRDFETNLAAFYYADPVLGYNSTIDVDSAIDFILLNELAKNVDGYRLSTFLYRDKVRPEVPSPKFVFGPIWDFNLGFGNADYFAGDRPEGFQVESVVTDTKPPFWFRRLWDERGFRARASARWGELRAQIFATDSITAWIDLAAAQLAEAQARDSVRWGNLGVYVWPNPVVWHSRAEETAYLKDWITRRAAWMDSQLIPAVSVEEGPAGSSDPGSVSAYPNPAYAGEWVAVRGDPQDIAVFDVLGRRVPVEEAQGGFRVPSTPGMYFLVFATPFGRKTQALLVTR